MELLEVTVSSLTAKQQFEAEWLEVEGPEGCFIICPGHVDLVSELKPDSQITLQQASGLASFVPVGSAGLIRVLAGKTVKILIFDN